MKRALAALFVLATLTGTATGADAIKEVRICWEDGLKPPYLMRNAEGQVTGIAVDMLEDIFRRRAIKAHHVLRPWKRCLAEVESGEADLVPNASYREERARFALYSAPLYQTNLVLFYVQKRFPETPRINGIDDMRRYRFGGILGFNYDQYDGQLAIETSATTRQGLLRMLEADRFDFAIEQLESFRMMERRQEISLQGISHVADPRSPTKDFHVLVSKRHPQASQLKQLLDEGIARQRQDHTGRRILDRYLGTN